MAFSFLNPWLWMGALALAAPVWLHLRRRVETNRLLFSTLRFLDDSPRPRSSPLRLQDVLLLLLRALALLLLVGAFAWPYLQEASRLVIRESRVYILDNTLSQQAANRFTQDRERLVTELTRAGEDIQIAVVELTDQPRALVALSDSREDARRRVRAIQPSFRRGAYLAAFRMAQSLLANSLGERKRIVFLGDSQANQWKENLTTPPFLEQVEVELSRPGASNAPNLALSEAQWQRIFLGDKALLQLGVNLACSSPASNATVSVRSGQETIVTRSVPLAGQPGIVALQAQWEAAPGRWLQGEVTVAGEPDALAADNRVYFTVPPVREGKVALLAQSPYLRLALSPEVMRGRWATRVLDPTRLDGEADAARQAEVLVLESSYLQSTEVRTLVERYLNNQRGVFLVVNRLGLAAGAALRDLGFEVGRPGQAKPEQPERIEYFVSNHPIFRPFLSADYGKLLDITIAQPQRIKPLEGMALLFSSSGEGLFFQGTRFPGRLFVLGFGLDRGQSSWPSHVSFIPFLDLCLQNARPGETTPLDYEPGSTALVTPPPDAAVKEVVLRDGQRELRRSPVVQGKAQVRLPDQPGIYAMSYDNAPEPERFISVNPNPKESELTYLEAPEALKLWKLERQGRAADQVALGSPARISRAAMLEQRIWWWLLVAGMAGLLGEMIWTQLRPQHP